MQTIVHDAAFQWGGAERVLEELSQAPVDPPEIRLIAGAQAIPSHGGLRASKITVQVPGIRSSAAFRAAVPFLAAKLPRAEPLVGRVSYSSYAVSRWLPSDEPRFIYNHAPMRQIWHGSEMYNKGVSPQALALRLTGPWLRGVDRSASRDTDYVVAPSSRIARLLHERLGVEVRGVIPPPVEDSFFSQPLHEGEPRQFVWVGRIVEPVKRLGLLVSLFADRPQDRLVVVGDGRDKAKIQRIAPRNVEFVGWLSGKRKASVIARSRALLLPSLEDFGLSAAEALALGVPVLVTPDAGISEWAEACDAIAVAKSDPASLRRALDGPWVRRGEAVREAAEIFSNQAFRRSIKKCWEEMGWLSPR